MARIRRVLLAVGGMVMIVASMTLAVSGGAALASSSPSKSCGYPTACGGLTTNSGSEPPGGTVTLSGHGYAPGTSVKLNVCGIETLTVTANSSGDFTTSITIPNSAVPGVTCIVTASGKGANGQKLTTSVSVIVTSGSTVPASPTGEPWASQLYWVLAAGVGLVGAAMFEIGRRRRFRSNT